MADTDKKYVPEGVFLVCDKGGDPARLTCDPHPIMLYSMRYADEKDNKPRLNIPSFGTCKTMGTCAPPWGFVWTKLKEDVRLHGARPLLEDSECMCSAGSGVIKIFFDEYEAEEAAESNNESGFVKEHISSKVLGMLGGGPVLHLISPELSEGLGRGLKKGLQGTWNFATHDIWQGETWVGMGKMAVIAGAYGTPLGALTGDATLGAIDNLTGWGLRGTRDAIVGGVKKAGGHAVENVRRGNWGEVGEDVGQIEYAVIEALAGSKGAGLALKGAKTGAELLVGAERLAQIAAKSSRALQLLKSGLSGVVKVGRKIDDVDELARVGEQIAEDVTENARRIAAGATNAEKGVFGEAMSDEWMSNQGFQKMNGGLVQIGDRPIGQGIDGVWRNSIPPPEYIVTESKYGTSRLGMTRDGQQMSRSWIENRLERAVGEEASDEIISSGYERWILQVDENGNVTRTIMR